MDLCPLSVIFVLARELSVLKLVQYLRNPRCGFGQHGLHWYPSKKVDVLMQLLHRGTRQCSLGSTPYLLRKVL
jgi:hypothetical protein